MTMTNQELRERGVSEIVIEWRRWRRAMHLTQEEAAAMVPLHIRTLVGLEMGEIVSPSTFAKLTTLMARWDESKRPPKKLDRRGGRRVKGQRVR